MCLVPPWGGGPCPDDIVNIAVGDKQSQTKEMQENGDSVSTDRLKRGVEVTVHPETEVVRRAGDDSDDSGSSRASTLIGTDIVRTDKAGVTGGIKFALLCMLTFHIVTTLANTTLATTLLPHTGPETHIRRITVIFSLFAIYFNPMAFVIAIALGERLMDRVGVVVFSLRFMSTLVAGSMTGWDAGSCYLIQRKNPDVRGFYQMITAISVLMCISLPLLAFEIVCVGCIKFEDEDGKAKTMPSFRRSAKKDTEAVAESV